MKLMLQVASRLYEVIEAAEGLDETGLPEEAYVPTVTGEHVPVTSQNMVFDVDADGRR
jgi:SH3 domain-containing YSC84-like protein 1